MLSRLNLFVDKLEKANIHDIEYNIPDNIDSDYVVHEYDKHKVVEVLPKSNFFLELKFENNEKRIFDFKPYLKFAIYQPLNDINFFMRAHIDWDSVAWLGNIDISASRLYHEGVSYAKDDLGTR